MDELEILLNGQAQDEGDGPEELRPPRRLATSANILAAQKWVSRNMLSQKIKPDAALAMLRTLALLRQELEAVEPENPEDDPTQLASFRRQTAEAIKAFEDGRKAAPSPPTTFKMRGSDDPDNEVPAIKVVDRRAVSQEIIREEPEPYRPATSAQAIVEADAVSSMILDRAKAEQGGEQW